MIKLILKTKSLICETKKIGKKKLIWCINVEGTPFLQYRGAFYPVSSLGRYSSFFKVDAGATVVVEGNNIEPTTGILVSDKMQNPQPPKEEETRIMGKKNLPNTVHYLIEMPSGNTVIMNAGTIREAILDDQVLLQEFDRRTDQDQIYYSFFLRYNQRHRLSIAVGSCD